jgi:hypothetical protein
MTTTEPTTNTMQPQFNRSLHGGLYDRGGADSYYGRAIDPHWYPHGTYNGEKVTELTEEEVAEYMEGYDYNEQHGFKKYSQEPSVYEL